MSLYVQPCYIIIYMLTCISLGVDQLPVAMRGPQGLLCFLTSTTPGGSKKVSAHRIKLVPIESKATPYNKLSIYM